MLVLSQATYLLEPRTSTLWGNLPWNCSRFLTNSKESTQLIVKSNLNVMNQYLKDLLLKDPRVEKDRIANTKDELLASSCAWVLEDPAFYDWWYRDDVRYLWIHGDPGKGKTMMAMTLIEEISQYLRSSAGSSGCLTYFFCQATVWELNDAISLLRGLIFVVIDEHRYMGEYFVRAYDWQRRA